MSEQKIKLKKNYGLTPEVASELQHVNDDVEGDSYDTRDEATKIRRKALLEKLKFLH